MPELVYIQLNRIFQCIMIVIPDENMIFTMIQVIYELQSIAFVLCSMYGLRVFFLCCIWKMVLSLGVESAHSSASFYLWKTVIHRNRPDYTRKEADMSIAHQNLAQQAFWIKYLKHHRNLLFCSTPYKG